MTSYAASHINPQGPGDARPTALQIIHDESLEEKLVGKVIVITGASSGIGLETARALSITGATLFLPVRNVKVAQDTLAEVLKTGHVFLVEMDLGSFASIRDAANSILTMSNGRINILINNAGVFGSPEFQLTKDGHELHFGTNHLGHFLLFQLLKGALLASSSPEFHSRVVNVASSGHRSCRMNESDNYEFQKGGYNHLVAYSQSKLANIYMANELDRRYGRRGLHATSINPGGISTNISRNVGPEFVEQFTKNEKLAKQLKSAAQGAATTVVAAVGREWENKGGVYLENCNEASRGEDDGSPFNTGSVSHTYDQEKESRLWKDSLELVGLVNDN